MNTVLRLLLCTTVICACRPEKGIPRSCPQGMVLVPKRAAATHNNPFGFPPEVPATYFSVDEFCIDQHEFTVEKLLKCRGDAIGCPMFDGHADDVRAPVSGINIIDAEAACRAVGKRLPTWHEWESAAEAIHLQGPIYCRITDGPCPVPERHDGLIWGLADNVFEWVRTEDADRPYFRGGAHSEEPSAFFWVSIFGVKESGVGLYRDVGFRCAQSL
jgi:hypothetical protein